MLIELNRLQLKLLAFENNSKMELVTPHLTVV